MSRPRLRSYGGWTALAAGSLEILGMGFLILFFAIELPQGPGSGLRFGYLSDVTPILVAPIKLVVIGTLFLLTRRGAPGCSLFAAILGTAGILTTAWTNILFVSERITLEQQVQWFYISLAFLGAWHILLNSMARKAGSLPSPLTTFGIWVGAGLVIMYLGSSVLGGYEEMVSLSLADITRNAPLFVFLAISIPLALIGYLGAPLWLVWLGRALAREEKGMVSLNPLDSR